MSASSLRRASSPLTLFLFYFCYATCAALVFQKFLVPLVPELHVGQGLLAGDSANFHAVAVYLAEQIQQQGWSAWRIYPSPSSGLNTAVLAALYALFGTDPSLIIPVNAMLHALSGMLLALIARFVWPGDVGKLAGVIAGCLFIAFPSALNWYGQVHKDGFTIAGTLLVLYGWLQLGQRSSPGRAAFAMLQLLLGALLVLSARPYQLLLVAFALAMLLLILGPSLLRREGVVAARGRLFAQAFALAIMAAALWSPPQSHEQSDDGCGRNSTCRMMSEAQSRAATTLQWEKSWLSERLPRAVDRYAEAMARTRADLLDAGKQVGAGSLIDINVKPSSLPEVFLYLPRAVLISVFAPFPTTWLEKLSLPRIVGVAETAIWYLLAPGVLLSLFYRRSKEVLTLIGVATIVLAIYGFTVANVGSLHRVRYAYLFLLIMVAVAGWTQFFLRHRAGAKEPAPSAPAPATRSAPSDGWPERHRAGIVGSGIIVAVLTALGYLGFFARDVIMARMLGIGNELDAFLVSMVLPAFVVSVFAIPVGAAIVPSFLAVSQKNEAHAQRFAREVMFVAGAFVLVLALLLLLLGPLVLPNVAPGFAPEKLSRAVYLMLWMLPIVALSSPIVLGNAVLNALGDYSRPAAAQAMVAVIAIAVLIVLGERIGALAVIAGMFAGQVVNFVIVVWLLYRHQIVLRPAVPRDLARLRPFLVQYLPLVSAALFVNVAVPVNMGMAAALSEGAVSALGLGNKVVLFIAGVLGAAVATVVLPHFSRILVNKRMLEARRELSFFISAATLVTIPFTVGLLLAAEPLVELLFLGGRFGGADVKAVARVLEYGVLQIPFYTVNLILLEFAVASRRSVRVTLASLLGLGINIGLNLLFMPRLGAPGIALATTLALALATVVLLLLFHREGHIAWVDLITIALSWMLFITLAVCLHYRSYPGVLATTVALVLLIASEWPRLRGHARAAPAT